MLYELSTSIAQPTKVLIIDDCLDSVKLLSTIFSHFQCEADFAFDGQDAVPLIQNQRYDMLVLDWNMPRMGGHEMLMLLEQTLAKSSPSYHPIPVLVYTSTHHQELMLPELRKFQFIGHLDKTQSFSATFKSLRNTLALL